MTEPSDASDTAQPLVFNGNFTQQEPITDEAIVAAVSVLKHGRLHRYNVADNEPSETVLLETEFASYTGAAFCLACASGGYALHIALRAWFMENDIDTDSPDATNKVLTNAFTLSPVPGAIHNAGGKPILVETTRDLVIDLIDLENKIKSSGARVLMLSHMRGHLVDMDALMALLQKHNVGLIEDCAHTMGASWDGKASGSFGDIACYSTQTYKHINSGEGGLLISNNASIMARAIVLSGSYMLYDRHMSRPAAEQFESIKLDTPNMSGRMDNLRAAILRPQLKMLSANVERWNKLYQSLASVLRQSNRLYLPSRPSKEYFVGSSLQFLAEGLSSDATQQFLNHCLRQGVELKWFGNDAPTGYTSKYSSWQYLSEPQFLPESDKILKAIFDIRLPLTFSAEDCTIIGRIIVQALSSIEQRQEKI